MKQGAEVIRLVLLLICAGFASMNATESYIIRMRPSTPLSVLGPTMKPLLGGAIRARRTEQLQNLDQQQAMERLALYIVVRATPEQRDSLRALPWVEDISPNRRIALHNGVTNDSLSAAQWALPMIGAPSAWKTATGKGITVGVLDTGIDWEHADLFDRFAVNAAEDINRNGRFDPWPIGTTVAGRTGDIDGIDNDGNGYVDDVIGFDFVDQDNRNLGDDRDPDGIPFDEQGHGTSVAGVIGAHANNRTGIAGLAYDCKLVALRAFDATGNAEEDDVAAALLYAALNGVRVVNMSFGDVVDSPVIRDAIRTAAAFGCVLVASAGNTGTTSRQYPAGYSDVIVVASTGETDSRSPFSSTGSLITLSAPGQSITTTAVGNSYRTVQGTSFSAPYVAAAVALLLEQQPERTADELRGILCESSVDLGEPGWDPLYGAGRLQIDAALAMPGSSVVRIDAPLNEEEVDRATQSAINIVGTATSTSFNAYTIDIGSGIEPTSWNTLVRSTEQRIGGILGNVSISSYEDSEYTIRLRVELRNGRTIESRRRVRFASLPPSITSLEIINAWRDDRTVPVLTMRASRNTMLRVRFKPSDSLGGWRTTTDTRRHTRTHSLILPDMLPGVTYDVVVVASTSTGDSALQATTFTTSNNAAPTTGWRTVATPLIVGYVLNDVKPVYGNDQPTFYMNDLSSGSFGRIRTVSYVPSTFTFKDSAATLIPRGTGDSNGDGIPEVLCHVVGKTYLYQPRTIGTSPFATLLFADTVSNKSAAAMADITGDGREEIFMFTDSGMVAYTFRNGTYQFLAAAVNTSPPPPGTADNRYDEISCAVGDMDGDGAPELVYSDTDGDLLVFEFNGTSFDLVTINTYEGAGGSGYVYGADVDGDGNMEVVFGVPDSTQPNDELDYGRNVWTYRMLKAKSNGAYEVVWTDHFESVRYGIGYRNGVDGGQLDMKGGKEVVISVFPRLYVFRWNAATSTMEPILYHDDVATSRVLTYDFDKNGVNELGFCITSPEVGFGTGMFFLEKDTTSLRINAPLGLRASLVRDSVVDLRWNGVAEAKQYDVQRTIGASPIFRTFASTTVPMIRLDSLLPRTVYRYRVVAIPNDAGRQESFRTNVVEVRYDPTASPLRISPSTIEDTLALRGIALAAQYSGMLRARDMEPSVFTLVSQDGLTTVIATSAVRGGDSTVVISFPPFRATPGAWTLLCSTMPDATGLPTRSGTLALSITTTALPAFCYLQSLRVVNSSEAVLRFSEPVSGADVERIEHYELAPSGRVLSVTSNGSDSVRIQFDPSQPLGATGRTYYLTVRGVKATSGLPITTGAGNTLGMVFTAPDLSDVYVFPHPVHLNTDRTVTFANLTGVAQIEIFDQNFTSIVLVKTSDANGGVAWDLKDANGSTVPPGFYFYRVTGTDASGSVVESSLKKLRIDR